ncbi:hypothetical protein TIFTF001_036624 [Ficus carica]|uniref:Uncharacterized protein n=1 Tax=Ficus carica TaxID=3494 RepID=A0AA88E4M8_FICCA|nr:hypothetical protein TIFTF001_036601 [Ficus carica]GMN67552.1 hypothetical protein TIFTF001_036612 [Ficus carica]GMN67553.1 hypothetical protein TIFTF001_036614 [Ficus carica]GMN67564.1 hypothetical protein TIFTF001_036624 [Ficus carica]
MDCHIADLGVDAHAQIQIHEPGSLLISLIPPEIQPPAQAPEPPFHVGDMVDQPPPPAKV